MGKPTEELRKLLLERGVKYEHHREPRHTWYTSPTLGRIYIFENQNGWLFIRHDSLTPEQVIDATLGRTAKAVMTSNGITGHCKCGRCGKYIDPWDSYCRHCGAEIEQRRSAAEEVQVPMGEGAKKIFDRLMEKSARIDGLIADPAEYERLMADSDDEGEENGMGTRGVHTAAEESRT